MFVLKSNFGFPAEDGTDGVSTSLSETVSVPVLEG